MHGIHSSVFCLPLLLNRDSVKLPLAVPHSLEQLHMFPINDKDGRMPMDVGRVVACQTCQKFLTSTTREAANVVCCHPLARPKIAPPAVTLLLNR